MPIILDNAVWMPYNLLLAFVPLVLAYLGFVKKYSIRVRLLIWGLWLLFLPNAIYVLTDILHFGGQVSQIPVELWFWLVLEYLLLYAVGILCYFGSMYLFEKYIFKQKWVRRNPVIGVVLVSGLNLLMVIGVMMGRFQRTNSWDVFYQPVRVINDFVVVLRNIEVVYMMVIFWLLVTMLYFLLKRLAEIRFNLNK